MSYRSSKPIESRNDHNLNSTSPAITHESVELWPAFLCSTPASIAVLLDVPELPLLCPGSQRLELGLNILAVLLCRDAGVERNFQMRSGQNAARPMLPSWSVASLRD